jgi:hypothetical protein
LTLEDLQREPTIYLVAECDSPEQAIDYLGDSVRDIFEEQLDGWYRVPAVWPAKRDTVTFQSWFDISFHSMIVDICDDALEHEELRNFQRASLRYSARRYARNSTMRIFGPNDHTVRALRSCLRIDKSS